MQAKPSRPGRPSLRVDPHRLRQLRKSKKLTQEALILRVYEHLGHPTKNHASESLKKTYQRWEKTGNISPQNANALAMVLGVTVSILQGEAPPPAPSRLETIQCRIREQLAEGNKPLRKMLADESQTERRTLNIFFAGSEPTESDATTEREKNLSHIARQITQRLEYAQLSQDQNEMNELSTLLGYSLAELQKPVSEDGLWLLLQDGLTIERPCFFHGLSALLSSVNHTIQKFIEESPCDARITLQKDGPWFRIQIFHPRWHLHPELQPRLNFVRGQPSAEGLQWTQPSWCDDFLLRDFESSLSTSFNYIKGLDESEKGAYSPSQLKLAIHQCHSRKDFDLYGLNAKDRLIAVTGNYLEQTQANEQAAGDLTEKEFKEHLIFQENHLKEIATAGYAHDAATLRLCANLLICMQPWLSEWPLKYWEFKARGDCISVELDAPLWLAQQRQNFDFWGTKYLIYLVEQSPQTGVRYVPWRSNSIKQAVERIQRIYKDELAALEIGPPLSPHLTF